jgi:hypothetical protein
MPCIWRDDRHRARTQRLPRCVGGIARHERVAVAKKREAPKGFLVAPRDGWIKVAEDAFTYAPTSTAELAPGGATDAHP